MSRGASDDARAFHHALRARSELQIHAALPLRNQRVVVDVRVAEVERAVPAAFSITRSLAFERGSKP